MSTTTTTKPARAPQTPQTPKAPDIATAAPGDLLTIPSGHPFRAAPSSPDADPDFIDRVVALLAEYSPDVAAHADAIADDLRQQFGGQRWYIHAKPQTARERRVAEVLALFNGRNATAVARQLGIARATVYRILKQPARPEAAAESVAALPSDATQQPVRSGDGLHPV